MWHYFQYSRSILHKYRIVLMLCVGICCYVLELKGQLCFDVVTETQTVYLNDEGQQTIYPIDFVNPTGTIDECDDVNNLIFSFFDGEFEITELSYNCDDIGQIYTIYIIAIDKADNRSEQQPVVIEIKDGIAPNLVVVTARDIYLDNTGNAIIDPNDFVLSVSDNCTDESDILLLFNDDDEDIPNLSYTCTDLNQTKTIHIVAIDQNENRATRSTSITIKDNIPPVITCPTVMYPPGKDYFPTDPDKCTSQQSFSISATDNCTHEDQLNISYEITNNKELVAFGSGDITQIDFPVGTNIVSYTVTDASGNTDNCSFEVQINDDQPPVAECKDVTVTLNDVTGKATITASQIDNGSWDNCGIVKDELNTMMLMISKNTDENKNTFEFDCTNLGNNNIVTLTVYDEAGNSASCPATITVQYDPLLSPQAEFLKTKICNHDHAELELTSPGFKSVTGWIWTVDVPQGITPAEGLDGSIVNSDYTVTQHFHNVTDDVAEIKYTITPKMYENDMCQLIPIERTFQIASDVKFDLAVDTVYGGHNISCYGFSDGVIRVVDESGGWSEDGYNYEWKGVANASNTSTITNRQAGTHGVTVSDKLIGCKSYQETTLTQPKKLDILLPLDKVNPNCYGPTGSFTIHARGGTRSNMYPYEYNCVAEGLMNDYTGPDSVFTAKPSGNYRVTVSDVNKCTVSTNYYLDYYVGNNPLNPGWNKYNVSCYGENDGRMNPNITAASAYTWKYNGVVFKDSVVVEGNPLFRYSNNDFLIEHLAPGVYELSIVNEIGCVFVSEVSERTIITQPDPIIYDFVTEDVSCVPGNDGYIKISNVSGGNPGYAFTCNDIPATSEISGLSPGSYTVVITDASGCKELIDTDIRIPLPLSITTASISDFNGYNIDCYGNNTGEITLLVQNGRGEYVYQWNSPDATIAFPHVKDQANLTSGTYLATVTDRFNCEGDVSVTLTQPERFWAQTIITDITCPGENTGSIQILTEGGVMPYHYRWPNNAVDSPFANQLTAGAYEVRITDRNNCDINLQATVAQPPLFQVNFIIKDAFCPETDDGDIRAIVSGGTSPYTYSWSGVNGATSPNINELRPGIYSLEITDDSNCRYSQTAEVGYTSGMCLRIPNAFSPNDDGANDHWEITVGDPASFVRVQLRDLYPEAIVEVWAANWGMMLYRSQKGYPEPWNGKYHGKYLPVNSYLYIIRLNNHTSPITGNVTIIR